MNTNRSTDSVFFYERKHYELSNFSSHAVEIDGAIYLTSEHAYQCMKFDDQVVRNMIIEAKSAFLSKRVSREYNHLAREDWNSIKVGVMESILRSKLAQHEDVRDSLMRTGNKIVYENSPTDLFWGCGADMSGENHLGKLWMKIRDETFGEK